MLLPGYSEDLPSRSLRMYSHTSTCPSGEHPVCESKRTLEYTVAPNEYSLTQAVGNHVQTTDRGCRCVLCTRKYTQIRKTQNFQLATLDRDHFTERVRVRLVAGSASHVEQRRDKLLSDVFFRQSSQRRRRIRQRAHRGLSVELKRKSQ